MPIQKLQSQRPVRVDAQGAAILPGASRPKKRGRLAAVASAVTATTMLALCLACLVWSPLGASPASQVGLMLACLQIPSCMPLGP